MLFFILHIFTLAKFYFTVILRKKTLEKNLLIFCIQSEASKDKQLKRQNSNVSKSDIAIDVNENPAEDSPPESERKEAVKVEEPEVTQKKGSYMSLYEKSCNFRI